jgi:hypothetical protein
MEAFLHACDFTPTELREAVILACTRHEMYNARHVYRMEGGSLKRIDRAELLPWDEIPADKA